MLVKMESNGGGDNAIISVEDMNNLRSSASYVSASTPPSWTTVATADKCIMADTSGWTLTNFDIQTGAVDNTKAWVFNPTTNTWSVHATLYWIVSNNSVSLSGIWSYSDLPLGLLYTI